MLLTELPGGDRGDGIVAQEFIKDGTTLIETTLDDTVLTAKTPQTLAENLLNFITYDYYTNLLKLNDNDMPGCFTISSFLEDVVTEAKDPKTENNKFKEILSEAFWAVPTNI